MWMKCINVVMCIDKKIKNILKYKKVIKLNVIIKNGKW